MEKLYQEKYPGKTLPDESILYHKEFVSHIPGLIRKHIPEVFDYPDLPNNKLIIQMTDPEPQKRPSMQKINQHLNSIYRKAPMAKLYGQSQSNDNIRVDKQEHKTGCLTIHSSRKKRAPPRMT